MCVQAPASEYLDPCLWSTRQTMVTLAAGQNLTGQSIQAAGGAFVRVRLQDAQKRLKASLGSGKSAPMLIGIWTPAGIFLPLTMMAEDEDGRNYQVLVPWDSNLRLAVSGGALQLEDEKRVPVPSAGAALEVRRNAQDAHQKTLVFHVK